jgi:hypothetical protein
VSRPLLFYAGGSLVSSDQARRLADYVEQGGTLVVFQPDLPGSLVADPARPRHLESDLVLVDPLVVERSRRGVDAHAGWPGPLVVEPSAVTTAAAPQRLRLSLSDAYTVELSSPAVFVYAHPPGEPIVAERIAPLPPTQEGGHAHVQLPVGERLTVGYLARRDAGRIVILGVSPTPELVLAIHAWLGVRIACRTASNPRLHSALFRRGNAYAAILTNTAPHAQDALLQLDLPGTTPRAARDLRTGLDSAVTNNRVTLRVPARSGTAVRLA